MEQKDILHILSRPEICRYLNDIGQVHMYTKHYLLISEEISEAGVTFLQPLKEHRDAYDHLTRIFSLPLKKNVEEKFEPEKYIMENIKKAYGHEYRAFFDTVDWLTYICRKYIREELSFNAKRKKYERKFSDFEEVKKFINDLPFLIAKHREQKDISNSETVLAEVLQYKSTLDCLIEYYQKVKAL